MFNLKDRDRSDHYNLFAYIKNEDDILVVTKNLVQNLKDDPRAKTTADPIWEEGMTALLEALIGYVFYEEKPENRNMNSVMTLLLMLETSDSNPNSVSQLDLIFEDLSIRKPESFAAKQYKLYKMAPGKTAQSINVSLGLRMSAFNVPSIADICADDTIDLRELGSEKKVALFVVTPDTTTAYNFLAAVMFQQCFQVLVDMADHRPDHRLPRHLRFLLDEFPNIGMIPDFQILISTIRSRDIACTLIYQSLETMLKKPNGLLLYRAAHMDGTWVPADALGAAFTAEGIDQTLKNGTPPAPAAVKPLPERYREWTVNYPEICETAVKLTGRQILSAGRNGLLLRVQDENGNAAKMMTNREQITTSPDGEVTLHIGRDFRYNLVYEDGTHGTIRGAALIRQIDDANGVQPLVVPLAENQVKAMSLRGVTITLPQQGIERLFVPESDVVRNPAAGMCAVRLYHHCQYSYLPTGDTGKRLQIQGDRLAQMLGFAVNPKAENTVFSRRIAAVERRKGVENAKFLGKMLMGMADENLFTAADYDAAIGNLGKRQISLSNEIAALQEKKKGFAAIAKSLETCRTLKPLWQQYTALPLKEKSAFYAAHAAELQAYHSAAAKLEKAAVDQTVEAEKVIALAENLEQRIQALKEQRREAALQEQNTRREQQVIMQIQDESREDRRGGVNIVI